LEDFRNILAYPTHATLTELISRRVYQNIFQNADSLIFNHVLLQLFLYQIIIRSSAIPSERADECLNYGGTT